MLSVSWVEPKRVVVDSWRESQHNIPKRGRGSLSISRVERGRSSMKDMDVSVIRVRLHGGEILRGKLFGGVVLVVCLPNLKCRLHLVGFFLLITKLVVMDIWPIIVSLW